MATPSSSALTPISPIGSPPPASFRPTIAAPPFLADIQFTSSVLGGRAQAVFKNALQEALLQSTTGRENALANLGLRASKDPRGGFIVEAANGGTIAEFIRSSGQIGDLTKVAINAPPFIDPRIEFNDDVMARLWNLLQGNSPTPPNIATEDKQPLFKAHLEKILRNSNETERNSALQALGLKAEMRDFRGVAGWHIEDVRNEPGWFGNNIKHGYFGTHKPIAKMNGQDFVRVPAGSTPHLAPRQLAHSNLHPHSPENLKALAQDALDRGQMMDLGTKGAYVLLPDCGSAIIIPSGSGEDNLDYGKIRIVQFMNSDTGEKITNDTILKNAVETLMDCQSEIDKLTNGGNFWITIGTDINGQLMIKVIPNRKNDLVLDLKDITDTGEEVSISGELQKAYANRLEKGCSGVPKKKKRQGASPFDDVSPKSSSQGSAPAKRSGPSMEELRGMSSTQASQLSGANDNCINGRSDPNVAMLPPQINTPSPVAQVVTPPRVANNPVVTPSNPSLTPSPVVNVANGSSSLPPPTPVQNGNSSAVDPLTQAGNYMENRGDEVHYT